MRELSFPFFSVCAPVAHSVCVPSSRACFSLSSFLSLSVSLLLRSQLLSNERKETEVLAKLQSLATSNNSDTKNYAEGTLEHWKRHYQGAWPPQ